MTAFILATMINSHESGVFTKALRTLRTWQQRARDRRELARWSARELHDIGVSWSDVADEVNKPFWRA